MYQCTHCGDQFETGMELNKHRVHVHPGLYIGAVFCEVCGEFILETDTTQGKMNFDGHMALHGAVATASFCPICGENYKELHMAAWHDE